MLTQNLGNKEWPHHPKTNKVINVENLRERLDTMESRNLGLDSMLSFKIELVLKTWLGQGDNRPTWLPTFQEREEDEVVPHLARICTAKVSPSFVCVCDNTFFAQARTRTVVLLSRYG